MLAAAIFVVYIFASWLLMDWEQRREVRKYQARKTEVDHG